MANISKSILLVSIFLIMFLCISGTAAAVTEISDWNDFQNMRDDPDEDFVLRNDLDFEDYNEELWEPIGTSDDPFTGTFDGGEFVISNLVLTEDSFDGKRIQTTFPVAVNL